MSLILLIIAPIAFKATIPSNIPIYLVTLALFIATCLSVGMVIGLFIKSTSKLTMISQLVFLPSIMLSGIMFPADMLPDFLQGIGKILPATWGYQSMCKTKFDITTLMSMIIVIIICIIISLWKIKKLKLD